MIEWQDISTAPSNGARVVLYGKKGAARDFWIHTGNWDAHEGYWRIDDLSRAYPTHWMPLPKAPKDE